MTSRPTRKCPWRKHLTRAMLCLLLGALTTVGVAWGGVILPARGPAEVVSISGGDQLWVVSARHKGVAREAGIAMGEAPPGRANSARVAVVGSARELALRTAGETTAALLPRESLTGSDLLLAMGVPFAISPNPASDSRVTSATTMTSGFPSPALSMVHHKEMASSLPLTVTAERRVGAVNVGSHHVPYRPILPGFLLNTLFYAAPWWVILVTPGAIRRSRRRRRGRCVHCGYDLAGLRTDDNTTPTCPECGA